MFKARISLDHVWPQLESGMSTLLNEFCKGIPFSEWMTLYTYVLSLWGAHKDHSEQNTHARKHTRARARPGGVGVDATQPCARLLHHDAAELGEPDQGQWRVLWRGGPLRQVGVLSEGAFAESVAGASGFNGDRVREWD